MTLDFLGTPESRRILIGTLLLLTPMLPAQTPSPNGQPTEAAVEQQHWRTQCMPKGCILSADILRGAYISTPNPSDVNQYVSVAIAVDRTPRKTNFLMFEVDPHADKNAGIVIAFGRTVRDGTGWKVHLESAIPLAIDRCDTTTCKAIVPRGTTNDGIDLVAKMQEENQLFLLYTRNDQTYRTAVDLDVFKVAYQRMLATELNSPPTSAR